MRTFRVCFTSSCCTSTTCTLHLDTSTHPSTATSSTTPSPPPPLPRDQLPRNHTSKEGRKDLWTRTQRADGATAYGHTTPTRHTPCYLRDYHNDDTQTQLPASRRAVCPQSPKHVTWAVHTTPPPTLTLPEMRHPKPNPTRHGPGGRAALGVGGVTCPAMERGLHPRAPR